MNTHQHIIKHLYAFFNYLSEKSNSKLISEDNFNAVTTRNSSWPNFIFNVKLSETSLTQLVNDIDKNHFPNHIILDDQQAEQHENLLTENGFFPLAEWACLAYDTSTPYIEHKTNLTIKRITTKEGLEEWVKVASSGFGSLDFSLFENCLNNNEIVFYSGYYQHKIVATALLFHHNNIAGIYHVVTLPEARKKGFGSQIFSYCKQEALKNGAKRVIAQSTSEGLKAWKDTGMKQYGNFYLFCWNKLKP